VVFFPWSWEHPVLGKLFKFAVGAHTVVSTVKAIQRQKENSARLMDRGEEKTLFSSKHRGLLIDGRDRRLSHEESFKNLALIATTGAGKTSTFIIPNLLSIDDASMVVTDPSGALYASTAHDLRRRGFEVLKLDPLDLMGSIRYNPLDRARSVPDMNEVAHILVSTANQGGNLDPFWLAGAEDIIGILMKCLKNHPEARRYANLANLHNLLLLFGDGSPLNAFVTDYAPDRATFNAFVGFCSQAERTYQGMVSQAKTSLGFLSNPDIAKLTAGQSFAFEQLRAKKTAIFLVFPQNRIEYYSVLMNLFYTQLFHLCLDDRAYGDRSLPVYFLLDEFGHLKIPGFSSIITTTRQRRISLSIVLQSVSQLVERYGRDGARTILNGGIANRLFLSVSDIHEAQEISQIVGDVYTNRMNQRGEVRTEHEPMITPSALMAMKSNQALLLPTGMRPAIFETTRYFERRDFAKRAVRKEFNGRSAPVFEVDLLPL
jgi:type IV secretion system protein VirD4